MLEYDLLPAVGSGERLPVIVLLHGRGADRTDLRGLRPQLPAGAALVLPQAPFRGERWGYGPGWAWYLFLGERRPEPESFEASLAILEDFINGLPEHIGVKPAPLILGGFSQGATLATAFALRNPGSVPLVLNFSGFVAEHPELAVAPATVAGTRFFWGHGTEDPLVPFAWAQLGRAALRQAGAALKARDYPIGHWISPAELSDANAWLDAQLLAGG